MFVGYNIFMSSIGQKKVYQILLIIFLLGTLLRLYRLDDFAIFLGDQGRDAIIMKRIVTFEHFPAVGPSSSVGQVYLGPFYYYFMAPWLSMFHMNPIGPVVGVALLSSLFIVMAYLMIADIFDRKTAMLTSIFIAFSSTLIDLSRFSWNPNILPMFSFIAVYFFIKAILTKDRPFFILTGLFAGFAFQLHYVMFSLLFAFLVISLHQLSLHRKKAKQYLISVFLTIGAFITVNVPLIFFDLRHQFLNLKNFITLFNNPGSAGVTSISSIIEGFSSLNIFAYSLNLHFMVIALMIVCLMFSYTFWKDTAYRIILIIFIVSLVVTSFMTANKFPHYFGILYPLYYLIASVFLVRVIGMLNRKHVFTGVLLLLVGLYIYTQGSQYNFLKAEPNMQIAHAEKTAEKIFPLITKEKYRLTAIPDSFGYSAYGYFLEVWGKVPVNNLTLDPADEMIVLCERGCEPIGNPQWDVAFFKARSVETSFTSDHVFVYKLIH